MKNTSKTQLRPEIVEQLNGLNHETVGSIADRLGITPHVVRTHIKHKSPSSTRHDFLVQIQRVLKIKNVDSLLMPIE